MTMTSRPIVSVVIPCFNQGRYLAEAIDSAISTHFPVQVIVVDDGSADDTAAVAGRVATVKYVRQVRSGLAAARNRGLAEATGEFVVFLDADDRLLPGAIDIGGRTLAARPQAAMTYGRCVMIGPDGATWPTPEQPVVRAGHHAALLRTNLIWMPAMAMFRRADVDRLGGFRRGFDGAADYDLYLRVTRDRDVHDHGQPVAAYRQHASSMSVDAARMLRETLAVMLHNHPADEALDAVWREGYRNWQEFYGTRLVEEIRADVHHADPLAAARKALTLVHFAPHVFMRELVKKTRVSLLRRASYPGR
jgi:glycosyltransferase involved in cell wall biosynthesis